MAQWYPADLVTRVLPRPVPQLVLFHALDGDDDGRHAAVQERCFGHRLVMNEDGKPMHKSDGTAIWFEEAAEQLGVDTMRLDVPCRRTRRPTCGSASGIRTSPSRSKRPTVPSSRTQEGCPPAKWSASRPTKSAGRS